MASSVEICNMALTSIGHKTITSLAEETEVARKCNIYYQQVVDAVIRAYPWNCAMARTALVQFEDAPAFGFSYRYALPQDPYCLRVLQLEEKSMKFKVEGRELLTDEATANIIYLKRVSPAYMDSMLIDAIAARLASELAYPLANSHTLQANMWKIYGDKKDEASQVDAQEGTPDEVEVADWIESRL